ncbi:hypothetical protein NC651_011047 [Populus alba x Populus x berolinensis]|nr:hypothetical protein NC651_011047 [Populus alba x Populus x berolinensis]
MATTSNKPQRSLQEIEDIILRRILSVSLADSSDPRIFYLEMTAAEILSEGKDLKLTRDLIERVLIDRLSVQSPNAEPPFNYLLGCYRSAVDELKKIANMKDKNVKSELELSIKQVKKLSVSYCRIHLGNPDMFGGDSSVVRKNGNSNVSPVLPLIFAMVDGFNSGGIQPPPPGFLEEFFREGDFDSLDPILKGLYEDLRGNVLKVSVLGNFQQPLRALLFLVSFNVGAKSLVSHKWWIPTGAYVNGRVIEMTSILGPFFHVSAWPDNTIFKSEPDVGQQCFSDATNRRPADLLSSFTTIKTLVNNLYDGLAEVLLALLKNGDTRESVLQYLAEVINRNATRAHIQVDPLSCASSGMFINLSAVMLKLSEPFLDANLSKRNKIDPNYVFHNNRLDLRGLTALLSSSEEITQWLNTPGKTDISAQSNDVENRLLQSQEATSSGSSGERSKYSFICECFFMTARVLNLGLLKAFSDFKHLVQEISRCEDMLSTFKALQEQTPSQQLQQDIDRLQKDIELYSQEKLCYEAQILRDGALIQRALSFYRLMLVWLVSLVGGFKMPLPSTCPKEFASMPEHFVEDAMELIIFASRIPKALDGVLLDDFMNFIIMFMASPTYIRNPYLRAKMVEVLNCWMPRRSGSSATASLFEGHQLSLEYLVRNLLKLYVDIELTGSHTQVTCPNI